MDLGNIKRNVPLSEQAFKIIREAIFSNKLKPGDVLTEEKLSQQLSISRTPIRTAFQQLVFNGLAETTSAKDITVANVTEKDVENITIVRKSLETLVMQLLKDHVTQEHINILKEICHKEREIIDKEDKDYLALLDLDSEFHITLAKITGNPFLVETIERAKLISSRYHILSGTMYKYGPLSVEEHALIFKHLKNGEFDFAELAMKSHIDKISARILI